MRNLIFIGTLHAGITPKDELADILKGLKPTQLLVEIQQKDIASNNLKDYPDEMIFAYHWAIKNKIPAFGFDSGINELSDNATTEDEERLVQRDRQIVSQHNWKDFNKDEYMKLFETEEDSALVNEKKSNLRELEMLQNINGGIDPNGTIIVLTGAYHLKYFENKFKDATFPYRH